MSLLVGMLLHRKGDGNTYFPTAGEVCLISGPHCDDENGYVFVKCEVLWVDSTFIVYRLAGWPNCTPVVNKWEHIRCEKGETTPDLEVPEQSKGPSTMNELIEELTALHKKATKNWNIRDIIERVAHNDDDARVAVATRNLLPEILVTLRSERAFSKNALAREKEERSNARVAGEERDIALARAEKAEAELKSLRLEYISCKIDILRQTDLMNVFHYAEELIAGWHSNLDIREKMEELSKVVRHIQRVRLEAAKRGEEV